VAVTGGREPGGRAGEPGAAPAGRVSPEADRTAALDLGRPRRIHVVGVGGAGMSAIATVLVAMGHEVSGSDLKESGALERLRALGVRVFIGHDAANLGDAELVTISSAVDAANPEVAAARRLGIPVTPRAATLAAIAAERRLVAVAGTHGKTTTSSMLALALVAAGCEPSFVIGGDVNEIGSNAVWAEGEWLVAEADESDGTFLVLDPELAVVTSVEPDHLEHYGSFEELKAAFARFLAGAAMAVVGADDPVASALAPARAATYGFAPGAQFRITSFSGGRSDVRFELERDGEPVAELALPVPGEHNARNATAAFAAAALIGAGTEQVSAALARFAGVARRFEFRGEARGVTFVDDYAHLPGEIAAVIAAARRGGWRRIVCVFQPHRYSRVAGLWRDFADAFVGADLVVITGIYGAGEAPRPGVSARLVADAVTSAHPDQRVAYLERRGELVEYLHRSLEPGDCCLTLGAGDLTSLPDDLLAEPSW
jgi:UDP-N-acetylmuramate--alanine ligase